MIALRRTLVAPQALREQLRRLQEVDPSAQLVPVEGVRGRFLDLLCDRAQWLSAMEMELPGFPPEALRCAVEKVGSGVDARELLRAIKAINELRMQSDDRREPAAVSRAAYAIGQLIGMDPKDPNMRLWAGESVGDVFGL